MEIKELKELIEFMKENEILELEIEEKGKKVKLSRGKIQKMISSSPQEEAEPVKPSAQKKQPANDNLIEIKAPMVGTFYRTPAPDADPYVKEGDRLQPGDVVCIIEAMKLMNEIKSEVKGEIVEILAENGEPVEYGQTLFLINPNQ